MVELKLLVGFVMACAFGKPAAQATNGIHIGSANLDDRDVVQAALIAVANNSDWWGPEPEKDRGVILGLQFFPMPREAFSGLLRREIKMTKHDVAVGMQVLNHPPLGKRELRLLNDLNKQSTVGHYKPPAVRPLQSYSWDRHVILALPSRYLPSSKPRLSLDEGWLTAHLPVYSPDGDACILDIDRPWGEGMSERDTFLLKRKKGHWTVKYISMWRPM